MNAYTLAKERYAALGVDTEAVLETLKNVTVSVHCWQGDDVVGFDAKEALSGGIQTTGNYPGKATTPEQLMADFDEVLRLTPGKKKLNLHASYAIFEAGEFADRDAIQPKHFSRWVAYAKERGLGIDFNPTFFSHSMVKDGLTLSSPDETVRHFWVEHGKRCMAIAEYFAEETGKPCVINFWIPDGYKDSPADRLSPRRRYAQSMDEILSVPYDKTKVFPCIESKVFGIGLEAYTVGSAEFCTNYVNTRHITPLMDNGHYHPTELVSDKISSMLLFNDRLALHITRPMRWDSDHDSGFVAGYRLKTEEPTVAAKGLHSFTETDQIQYTCSYYDYDFNYDRDYTLGDPVTYTSEPVVAYEEIGEYRTVIQYTLRDIYNNEHFTDPVELSCE